VRQGWVLVFLFAPLWATSALAQCVDSSEVNNFKVRMVRFRSLFGLVPKELRRQLDGHRGELYSANRASQYINEIVNFRSNDPTQQKYERLIANKLKLAVKGGQTWLECVEKIEPAECQKVFPGSPQCVDVTLKRYFVEIDALDSSPYLVLFPRSALAALYGAIPRPLLALNPSFDFSQDRGFGPSIGIDTATDLFDLRDIFRKGEPTLQSTPSAQARATPAAVPSPSITPDELEITFPGKGANVLSSAVGDEPPADLKESDTKLLLNPKARRSLTKRFYDTSARLVLARTKPLNSFQNLSLEGGFNARHLPHGRGDFLQNAATLAFNSGLRLKGGPVKLINVGGGYRWSRNRYFSGGTGPGEISSENGFETRALTDGVIGKGFMRAVLWFDGGALDRDRGSYSRVAALVGYGKDFPIPRKKEFHKIRPPELGGIECWTSYPQDPKKNEATLGVEILAGLGHSWGDVPEYARFYGGAAAGQFLYDEPSAQSLTAFPSGPLLRSLGQNRAGVVGPGGLVRGGTSYQHVNVNISFPIPAWSRPLIPHEWVTTSKLRTDDEEFNGHVPEGELICRDLKSTVKTLVSVSGVNLLVNQQARDLLTDEQKIALRLRSEEQLTAAEEAELDFAEMALARAKDKVRPEVEDLFAREILPVTNFIADHANLIAVKPLLMVDAGRLSLSGGLDNRTRYAAGGGLQIDIVLARFELGYVASLNRALGDARGNVVGRVILRRFF